MPRLSASVASCLAVALTAIGFCGGFSSADPVNPPNGAVLSWQEITPLIAGLALPAKGWQLHYASIDSRSEPVVDTTTVLVPDRPWSGTTPRPVLAYQIAEDSLGSQCSPSNALRDGLAAGMTNAQLETPVLATALMRGWAVVVTDYEGPDSQMVDRVQAAHAVLDGIRAALEFSPAGLSKEAPLGAAGYSGGGIATAWAGEQAPSYAPELNFSGVAFGGVPGQVDILPAANKTANSGMLMLALLAQVRSNPEVSELLNDRGKAVVTEEATACGTDLFTRYAMRDINEYSVVPDLFSDQRFLAAEGKSIPGKSTPKAPIYDFHAAADEVIPVASADVLVEKYCTAGVAVDPIRLPGANHTTGMTTGIAGAFDYLADRFAGIPATAGCA